VAVAGPDRGHLRPDRRGLRQAHTIAEFRRCVLPGDHFYLTTARPLLLRAIGHDLEL
jgi:surfactin synthase thioesterase subunit